MQTDFPPASHSTSDQNPPPATRDAAAVAGPGPSPRYHDLDALRAVAMLLGILLHAMMSLATDSPIAGTVDVSTNPGVYEYVTSAIHGFRMPLFYLVSGFFTAMLWQRRGLQRLATHRLIRIGIPLLVAGILLIPLMFGMAIAITRSPWRAAAEGDTAYVDAWIQSGQDLDRRLSADQPNKGSTMLHIAAELGSAPIVQKLCDAGADVNAPATIVFLDREVLSTPLHVAAKESNLDCVKILIAANADVNAIDAFDNSPLDYASSQEIKRVLRANGGVTVSEMSREDRENRQNVAREAVEAAGKSDAFRYRAYVMRQTPLFQLALTLSFFPPSFHLWFLYYLAVLTVLLIVIGALTQALGIPSPPNGLLRGPLFWLWATPLSMLMFFMMRQGFGPDTFTGPLPWFPTLGLYGIVFGFGAMCYGRSNIVQQWGRPIRMLGMGLVALLAYIGGMISLETVNAMELHRYATEDTLTATEIGMRALSAFCQTIYMWTMIFTMLAFFRQFCSKPSRSVRYVSDASYWMYLVHLPIIMVLQSWAAGWMLPSFLKIAFYCAIAGGIGMLTYALLVRYTPIGTVLHGKKQRATGLE